jgi:hypothetical protein
MGDLHSMAKALEKKVKVKEVEVVIVSFTDYTSYDFVEPGTYFSVSAMQDYYFYKTSDRKAAQDKCDEIFGTSRYVVKTGKTIKSKSKQENSGYSCTGTNTRRGFAANLRPS